MNIFKLNLNEPTMIEQNFIKLYEESISKNFDLAALSDYTSDISYTYGEMGAQAARLHLLYEAAGVKRGDKIAVFGKNSSNWCVSFLSVFTYGAVVVPILSDFKPADAHTIINHSESTMLFVDKQIMEGLSEGEMKNVKSIIALDDFSLICSKPPAALKKAHGELDELFTRKYPEGYKREDVKFAEVHNSEVVEINYTSGTTGFSKGVMLSGNSLAGNVTFAMRSIELHPGEKMLALLPLAHCYGCAFDFLFPLAVGVHVTILGKLPATPVIIKAFSEIKPHLILFVPVFFEKLYKNKILPVLNKGSMKILTKIPGVSGLIYGKIRKSLIDTFGGRFRETVLGGAPLSQEVEDFLFKIKFPYTIGYGMTECGPLMSYTNASKSRKGASGQILDILELKIDSEKPYEVPGEILIKGENLMEGYFKNEEATREAIDKDGWLHTGDLGVTDKDGFIFIKGRSKSMLLGSSGQNIYPEEIEARLMNMPYISEAVVLMNKDHKLEALVYPDPDAVKKDGVQDQLLEKMEENRKELNKHVAGYESVMKIHIHETEFEKTPKRSIKRFLYKLEE